MRAPWAVPMMGAVVPLVAIRSTRLLGRECDRRTWQFPSANDAGSPAVHDLEAVWRLVKPASDHETLAPYSGASKQGVDRNRDRRYGDAALVLEQAPEHDKGTEHKEPA
jgi:hypothetical protein